MTVIEQPDFQPEKAAVLEVLRREITHDVHALAAFFW